LAIGGLEPGLMPLIPVYLSGIQESTYVNTDPGTQRNFPTTGLGALGACGPWSGSDSDNFVEVDALVQQYRVTDTAVSLSNVRFVQNAIEEPQDIILDPGSEQQFKTLSGLVVNFKSFRFAHANFNSLSIFYTTRTDLKMGYLNPRHIAEWARASRPEIVFLTSYAAFPLHGCGEYGTSDSGDSIEMASARLSSRPPIFLKTFPLIIRERTATKVMHVRFLLPWRNFSKKPSPAWEAAIWGTDDY